MTKNEIKKAIETLNNKILEAGHYEVKSQEVVKAEGHGMFYGTGVYAETKVWVRDEEAIEAYRNEIKKLSALYEEKYGAKEEERARKAKIKRYEKELKELEERKAYLEKWLAENK